MLWGRRACDLLLIPLAVHSPMPGSMCATCRNAACESLKTAMILIHCLCNLSLCSTVTSTTSSIACHSVSKTSMRPVPSLRWQELQGYPCSHTAAAPTRPSAEHNPSVNNIAPPAPILTTCLLAHGCTVFVAAVATFCMGVLTTDSLPRAGQSLPLVVWPCSCSTLPTLQIIPLEVGYRYNSFSLVLHAFACLITNHCCLESKITSRGVSPDSPISTPREVVPNMSMIDLACSLRRSWRSSCVLTSLRSHQC